MKRQSSIAPQAGEDFGTGTAAARRSTTLERVPGDANGRRRRVRKLPWEDQRGLGRQVTPRQARAADRLHETHVATMASPSPVKVFVDATPDYGWSAVHAAQIKEDRRKVWGHVPSQHAAVVMHVCGNGRNLADPIENTDVPFSRDWREAQMHRAMLKVALDVVANALGY